jgi:hypothetical protein
MEKVGSGPSIFEHIAFHKFPCPVQFQSWNTQRYVIRLHQVTPFNPLQRLLFNSIAIDDHRYEGWAFAPDEASRKMASIYFARQRGDTCYIKCNCGLSMLGAFVPPTLGDPAPLVYEWNFKTHQSLYRRGRVGEYFHIYPEAIFDQIDVPIPKFVSLFVLF